MSGPERAIPKFRLRLARPERVLDAALEVFASKGFEQGRLEDVARLVGVTKPALYLHFASKQTLLEALVARDCLPDAPDGPGETGAVLERVLSAGAPARVLEFILGERRALPELGARYWDALVRKLAGWPGVTTREAAERLAAPVLGRVVFRMLFEGTWDNEDPR